MILKVLKTFTPILLDKIAELNARARDISLHTLISVFKHPAAKLSLLIDACLEITEQENEFGVKKNDPLDKQPARVVLARLEILANILSHFGYSKENDWNWPKVFFMLVGPSLFHPSQDVRVLATEIIASMYEIIGEEVRDAVNDIEGLKPNTRGLLDARLDEVAQDRKEGKSPTHKGLSDVLKQRQLSLVVEENDDQDALSKAQSPKRRPDDMDAVKQDDSPSKARGKISPKAAGATPKGTTTPKQQAASSKRDLSQDASKPSEKPAEPAANRSTANLNKTPPNEPNEEEKKSAAPPPKEKSPTQSPKADDKKGQLPGQTTTPKGGDIKDQVVAAPPPQTAAEPKKTQQQSSTSGGGAAQAGGDKKRGDGQARPDQEGDAGAPMDDQKGGVPGKDGKKGGKKEDCVIF
jgi:hypothetical protein